MTYSNKLCIYLQTTNIYERHLELWCLWCILSAEIMTINMRNITSSLEMC